MSCQSNGVKSDNCLSCSLVNDIRVDTHPVRGRCAVYVGSSIVRPGRVVMSCAPVATRVIGAENRKRYCSSCLVGDDDETTKQPSLLRCGRCRDVSYCSRACQRRDWKDHKTECASHARWTAALGGANDSSASLDDASLLSRTFSYLKRHATCSTMTPPASHDDPTLLPILRCGMTHWEAMEDDSSSIWEDESENARRMDISKLVSGANSNNDGGVLRALKRCSVNNFSIFNHLLVPHAVGVYPWSATLNHSCCPNCIVRYEFRPAKGSRGGPPILHLVATTNISPGEELFHSYVDITKDAKDRADELGIKYGIHHCDCARCRGDMMVRWPSSTNDGSLVFPMDPFWWETTVDRVSSKVPDDDGMITTTTWTKLSSLIDEKDESCDVVLQSMVDCCLAEQAMQNNDKRQQVGLLQGALRLYDEKGLFFAGRMAYRISARLQSLLLPLGRLEEALEACERVVCCLCVIVNMEHHPLIGLQLFTLADLYEGTQEKEKATRAYRWARRVLVVTHGRRSDLVKRLDTFL